MRSIPRNDSGLRQFVPQLVHWGNLSTLVQTLDDCNEISGTKSDSESKDAPAISPYQTQSPCMIHRAEGQLVDAEDLCLSSMRRHSRQCNLR